MKVAKTILLCSLVQALYAQPESLDSLKKPIELSEVVVLDQSEKDPALDFYKSSRQIGVENIMTRMQGISMIRRGNYAPDLVRHGMRNGQVGITIDGMQVFGACTDRMDPATSYVETNNLKSISVSDDDENGGCHSANIAGGVDLKIKEPVFGSGFSGAVGGGFTPNGKGYNGLLSTTYANNKWAINVNSVYRKFDNYTDGNGNEVLYSQYEKINFGTNFRYRVNKNQIVRLDFILDDAYNIGYAALPMDVAFAKARMYGITYHWYTKGFFKQITAKGYYNYIDHAMDDSKRPDVPIRMDMPGQSKTWGAFVEAQTKSIKTHSLYSKLEVFSNFRHADMTMYPNTSSEPDMYMLTWPDVQKTSSLYFIKDVITLNAKSGIVVSGKLQIDYNQIITEEGRKYMEPMGYEGPSTYVLPSLDVEFKHALNKNNSFLIHAGYASRGPSTSEQYGFYLFNAYDGYDYIGKPTIKAEQALKADLSYQLATKKWLIESSLFGYKIQDYILGITATDYDGMTIGSNGVRVYDNVSSATLYGAELAVSVEIYKWLDAMAKATFTRGILEDNSNLPLIPPLNGLFAFKANYKSWEAMFETEFASSQNKINEQYGDQKTPGYVVNNLRAIKTFRLKSSALNVELGVDNMFNIAYRNHLDWGNILRIGRNFYVQVKYSF